MTNLILHCDAVPVTRETLMGLPDPESMGPRHQPIRFDYLLDQTTDAIEAVGYEVERVEMGLTKKNERFFGLLHLKNRVNDDASMAAGIRASTNQSIASGLVFGSQVTVCDNLVFAGDVSFNRKQTTNILNELPQLMMEACLRVGDFQQAQAELFARLQESAIDRSAANDLIMRVMQDGHCPSSMLNRVSEVYFNRGDALLQPEQQPEPGTAWALYNAFTNAYKARFNRIDDPGDVARETIGLTALFASEFSTVNFRELSVTPATTHNN